MGWLYRGGTVWTGGEGLGSGAWRLALGGLAAELGCTQSASLCLFLFTHNSKSNRTGARGSACALMMLHFSRISSPPPPPASVLPRRFVGAL